MQKTAYLVCAAALSISLAPCYASSISMAATVSQEIELSDQARYALLSSLESRVGGKFVISGLKDASATCTTTKSCISVDQLQQQVAKRSVLSNARGIANILDAIDVNGNKPVTIVSLRSAGFVNGNLAFRLAVLDPQTGSWAPKVAKLGFWGLPSQSANQTIRYWQNANW